MNNEWLSLPTLRHGSLVRDRIVPAHCSLASWYRAHTAGHLVRLHAGVSRVALRPVSPLLRVEAAIAAAMPGSSAAGLTAAWLWGAVSAAGEGGQPIELHAPPYRHPGRLEGVVFHRPTDSPFPRVHRVLGLPTCDALRCTLDIAAWHPDRLDSVMAELMDLGRYDLSDLEQMLGQQRRSGRRGVLALERALARWDDSARLVTV